MILHDPPPTLESCGCPYDFSVSFQAFVDRCLHKRAELRLSANEALQHPFLRKAPSSQTLMRYVAKIEGLDKRPPVDHATSRLGYSDCPSVNQAWDFGIQLKDPEDHDASPVDSEPPMTPIAEWLTDTISTPHTSIVPKDPSSSGLLFDVELTKVGQCMRPTN
ncbi:hypothetical protein BX666DRAFT_1908351 [Dichotomocladium elegans]|nr:hypothetical protein BX666DRAFT_1908351 [Dichotomocladium elegans]